MDMLTEDLRHRIKRIANGVHSSDDLNSIFLGVRDRSRGRDSVREIGDFVAHRGEREKGLVTRQARDMFLSIQIWLRRRVGETFTNEELRDLSKANLRTATDQQLSTLLRMPRKKVETTLERALAKLKQGSDIKTWHDDEKRVFIYLTRAFIWRPAFTALDLMDDLVAVLTTNNLLDDPDVAGFKKARDFLSLHVLATIHGCTILLKDGTRAMLRAGYDNEAGHLEIKAELGFGLQSQPHVRQVNAPICLFLTGLDPLVHCDASLISAGKPWSRPLELQNGKLIAIP